MTRIPRSAPPPAPTPASPTTPSPTAAPTTITARLGNLFHRRSDRAGPRVVDVAYAQGRLVRRVDFLLYLGCLIRKFIA